MATINETSFDLKRSDIDYIAQWFEAALISAGADTASAGSSADVLESYLVNNPKTSAGDAASVAKFVAGATTGTTKESDVIGVGAMAATQTARIGDLTKITGTASSQPEIKSSATKKALMPVDEDAPLDQERQMTQKLENDVLASIQTSRFFQNFFREIELNNAYMRSLIGNGNDLIAEAAALVMSLRQNEKQTPAE